MADDYEAQRQRNIANNKAILASIGLDQYKIPDAIPTKGLKKRAPKPPKRSTKRKVTSEDTQEGEPIPKKSKTVSTPPLEDGQTRRSSRHAGKPRVSYVRDGELLAAAASSREVKNQRKSGYLTVGIVEDDDEDDDDPDGYVKQRNVPKMGKRVYDP